MAPTMSGRGALRALPHQETISTSTREGVINWLLVICFIASALLDSIYVMLIFVLLLLVTMLIKGDRWYIPLKLLAPLLLIAFVGFSGSIVSGLALQEPHRVIRDAAYHLSPVVGILVGVNLNSRRNSAQGYITSLFVASALASAAFLITAVRNGSIAQVFASDATFGVLAQGRISTYLALYCPLCLLADKAEWPLRAAHPRVVALVGFIGMMLCIFMQSRTMLLCLVICFLAVSGARRVQISRSSRRAIIVALIAGAVAFFMLPDQITGYFIQKIRSSLSELNSGGDIVWDDYNVVMRWRGYESYCFRREFSSFSTLQLLFGRGFGSLMDIGGYEWLVTGEVGGIPVLHNGYLGVLFKCGMLGLVLELTFLVRLLLVFRAAAQSNDCFEARLGEGLAVCMLVVTGIDTGVFMLTGLYFLLIPMTFLLGKREIQAQLSKA